MTAAAKAETKATEGKNVTRVVARGRTVVDVHGKSIGPGEKATIIDHDLERLVRLGFLVDPTAAVIPRRGPAVLNDVG